MRKIFIFSLVGIISIVALSSCAAPQKQTEAAIATLGGATPEDAYRKYFDYTCSGSFKEAFGILATPSRQVFDRAAVSLMQMRSKIDTIPDPQDRLYLQQLYAKLAGNTGEDLFIALMKMSEVPQGTTPISLGPVNQTSDVTAEATNSLGVIITFVKEIDGLWRIELPASQLEASLGALEARLGAIKTGTTIPITPTATEATVSPKEAVTQPSVGAIKN